MLTFFFTMLGLGILNLERAPGILTFANHYLAVLFFKIFMIDATQL